MKIDEIIEFKRKEVEKKKEKFKEFLLKDHSFKIRNFAKAIKRNNNLRIIGEIKKASPSKGIIRKNFSLNEIISAYTLVDAVSVLTEEHFFLGKLEYIPYVKEHLNLPILRKDFIIDEVQVIESALAGADAILLIVSILSKDKLFSLYNFAKSLGLYVLVEIHNEKELELALELNPKIIGVNNRNLKTFEVDINTTFRLSKLFPKDKIVVSESGIRNAKDIKMLSEINIDAVLIGESFMKAEDIKSKIKELKGDV